MSDPIDVGFRAFESAVGTGRERLHVAILAAAKVAAKDGYAQGRKDAADAIRACMAGDPTLSDLSDDNPFEGERYAMQHAARLAEGKTE